MHRRPNCQRTLRPQTLIRQLPAKAVPQRVLTPQLVRLLAALPQLQARLKGWPLSALRTFRARVREKPPQRTARRFRQPSAISPRVAQAHQEELRKKHQERPPESVWKG